MILIQTKDGMVCLPDHQVLSVRHNKQERTVNVVWLGTNPPTTYPDVISCTYTTEGQKVTMEVQSEGSVAASFPRHQLSEYLPKIIRTGRRVAIIAE